MEGESESMPESMDVDEAVALMDPESPPERICRAV